ncbi:MAG: DUF3021 domain-containing protein [Eubacteriales bacterium]|nr:DUF3021 domain-containing protein [Eubacteriales bacterium]
MKGILKGSLRGVGMALFMFCAVCIVFDIVGGGNFARENYDMTKMIVGALICGIAWGAPSVVYTKENLPRPMQILIHMGIGCVVYTAVAFAVGWIPAALSPGKKILIVACQIALAFAIWFGFHLHYKKEAKRMNEKIREMN